MSFTFRPATRENTPLIVGLAGPTKSGKTKSAHRLAVGLAQGGPVAMINSEGAKGHQYADQFTYIATEMQPPYRPERYTEALTAVLDLEPRPKVVIIDSGSHMHDGPGGLIEYQSEELDRLAGDDLKARLRMNPTAWIKPKAAENQFIYKMLGADCHIIICFRAKEKMRWVKGAAPIDLGWQPIAGERVAFETMFTLTLPPHSKGVPDLEISDMREPFDTIIPTGQQLSEETGRQLAAWAAGSQSPSAVPAPSGSPAAEGAPTDLLTDEEISEVVSHVARLLAHGDEIGKRRETQDGINKNERQSPRKHLEWLREKTARLDELALAGTTERNG